MEASLSLPDILSKIVEHVEYGALAAPVAEPIGRYVRQRAEDSFRILDRAVQGKPWPLPEAETVGMYLTYRRSAEEGAAEPNLRLMAEAMVNLAQEPTFSTATARRHLLALAGLSREEVVICAAFLRSARQAPDQPKFNDHEIWARVRDELSETMMFPSFDRLWGEVSGLCRTGWIAPVAGWDGGFWACSPSLIEVGTLVDFASPPPADDVDGANR